MEKSTVEKRVDRLEEAMMELVYQSRKTEMEIERLSRELREFKNEMRAFKEEMLAFKDEMNKKWGDLANKLGTIAEDIVAPGIPHLIKKTYDLDVTELSVRRKRKLNGRTREYDVIAVAGDYVFVVDVKSVYRSQYLDHFQEMLNDFFTFFPEYKKYKLVPVIASFNLPEDVINIASSRKWLALQMHGDYLEFVNKERVKLP
ncbi:conserved hypothetical protein [Thermosulfidibacter takaii ABI70S6]|uniref:DUF3782 domain-containing protein n=1 Tax=Thermosulfidibacter takaii (strain DSM 17441 / JCM 13301 / NBRC 103674 / ABI70S6) TaxID=1298851 RepID=A0A0S3QRK3_THET7|nr:hypothetical protein [Thermosulfidibacter takaii]BAT70976.1 conserved hypothetical protein [Thermosulfidibacter takaii ABI70S6]